MRVISCKVPPSLNHLTSFPFPLFFPDMHTRAMHRVMLDSHFFCTMVSGGYGYSHTACYNIILRETYTWSSRFGQLNDEVGHIPNINVSEGGGGRSFKQRLYDWNVHFTKELPMTSGKQTNKVLLLKEP